MTVLEAERPDLYNALSTERKFMTFNGLYKTKSNNKIIICLWNIMSVAHWVIAIGQIIAMFIDMSLNNSNIDLILETTFYLVTQICYSMKMLNFIAKRNIFNELEVILQSNIFNEQSLEQDKFLFKSLAIAMKLANGFRITCVFGLMLYFIEPFFDKSVFLPLHGEYLISVDKYWNFIYFYQVIVLCLSAATNSSIDCISMKFMSIAAAQFDVLKDKLTNLQKTTDYEEECIIRQCVMFHNEILLFVEKLDEMFANGILVQFIGSILVITATGFQMLVKPITFQYSLFITYFVCMLTELGFYCWFGHFVKEKSQEVCQACYMSKWYECGPRVGKILFIIMERTKRPSKLTVGKFAVLSLGTFVVILKSSYSYLAVLQQKYT